MGDFIFDYEITMDLNFVLSGERKLRNDVNMQVYIKIMDVFSLKLEFTKSADFPSDTDFVN